MPIRLNTSFLKAFSLSDSLLVWHQPTDSLHLLQGLAGGVFLGLDQGLSKPEILAECMSDHAKTDEFKISLDGTWQSVESLFNSQPGKQTQYQEEYRAVFDKPPIQINPEAGFCFQVNDLNYQLISTCSELTDELSQLCAHQKLVTTKQIDCQLVVTPEKAAQPTKYKQGLWRIKCNKIPLANQVMRIHLLPLIMDFIQILNYQSRDYLLAVHAATLVKNRQALILPGLSGSGKSTLCAQLLEHQFTCYSDELAVLDYSGVIQPLPLPIAIKTGSWPLLSNTYPMLNDATVWQRPDGRQLKYLSLPQDTMPGVRNAIQQQLIVFPHYSENQTEPCLQKLSPAQSLKRLTQVGYQIKNGLNTEKINHLIRFASRTPAYALTYNRFDHAWLAIQNLMENINEKPSPATA